MKEVFKFDEIAQKLMHWKLTKVGKMEKEWQIQKVYKVD